MTLGHPKPPVREPTAPKPIKRGKPIARGPAPRRKKKTVGRPKYLRKEWRDLRAKVLYRSKGGCEYQGPGCEGEASEVHHLSRGRGRGVKSLLVPMDQLMAVCHTCHRTQEHWIDNGPGLGSRERNEHAKLHRRNNAREG